MPCTGSITGSAGSQVPTNLTTHVDVTDAGEIMTDIMPLHALWY